MFSAYQLDLLMASKQCENLWISLVMSACLVLANNDENALQLKHVNATDVCSCAVQCAAKV